MYTGKQIVFIDKAGKKHEATVTALVTSGATGKTLDLTYGGGKATNVAHGADHAPGEGFWLLVGEEDPKTAPVARRKSVK